MGVFLHMISIPDWYYQFLGVFFPSDWPLQRIDPLLVTRVRQPLSTTFQVTGVFHLLERSNLDLARLFL